jgi:hypothetical protein
MLCLLSATTTLSPTPHPDEEQCMSVLVSSAKEHADSAVHSILRILLVEDHDDTASNGSWQQREPTTIENVCLVGSKGALADGKDW